MSLELFISIQAPSPASLSRFLEESDKKDQRFQKLTQMIHVFKVKVLEVLAFLL
jgi:hypothetical protein